MKLTLRKAAAIQETIMDTINLVSLDHTVAVDVFAPNVVGIIETAEEKFELAFEKKLALLRAYYNLRKIVGIANAKAGVTTLLADQKWVGKQIQIYKGLEGVAPALDIDLAEAKHERMVKQSEQPQTGYGRREDTYSTAVLSAELVKSFGDVSNKLRLEKQEISDKLLEINVATLVDVDTDTEEVLKKYGII